MTREAAARTTPRGVRHRVVLLVVTLVLYAAGAYELAAYLSWRGDVAQGVSALHGPAADAPPGALGAPATSPGPTDGLSALAPDLPAHLEPFLTFSDRSGGALATLVCRPRGSLDAAWRGCASALREAGWRLDADATGAQGGPVRVLTRASQRLRLAASPVGTGAGWITLLVEGSQG